MGMGLQRVGVGNRGDPAGRGGVTMGWARGTNSKGRDIGYAIEATCDEAGCDAKIDRGLTYVCGSMHDGDTYGCGRYFCVPHLFIAAVPDPEDSRGERTIQLCAECIEDGGGTDDELRLIRAWEDE